MNNIKDWQYHDINIEGCTKRIDGVNIWLYDWRKSDFDSFKVPHPQHTHQRHVLRPYFIETKGKRILFAAGEGSNLVWIIYVPKAQATFNS